MISRRPIWAQDYQRGSHLYTRNEHGGILHDGIDFFQSLWEIDQFIPVHMLYVVDQFKGIESSARGVEYCDLTKYFDDTSTVVISRTPQILDPACTTQAILYGAKLEKKEVPYDGAGLLGFALMFTFGLARWIKPLRKLPVPFHIPGARVCSGLVADMEKHTCCYKNIPLFLDWHISRIAPVMMYHSFPYRSTTLATG